jgi:hypothetical protein
VIARGIRTDVGLRVPVVLVSAGKPVARDSVRSHWLAVCRRYFVIIRRKLFPCESRRRGQRKPVNVRYRAVSCSNHTLKVEGAAYGRDGSEVCFRT